MTREEAALLIQRMSDSRPKAFFKRLDDTNAGIGCVLRYLSETDRPVSSGEISEYMRVSTARVAVILRKMSEKDLIVKTADPDDARKTMVSLSDTGHAYIREKKEEFLKLFLAVADRVGADKIEQLIAVSEEIKRAIEEIYGG